MNPLEEAQLYFEAQGYLVKAYQNPYWQSGEMGIGIYGCRSHTPALINGMELYAYQKMWYIVHTHDEWVLQRPFHPDQPFVQLDDLIPVALAGLGLPIEEPL
jgi:hypothetical protein